MNRLPSSSNFVVTLRLFAYRALLVSVLLVGAGCSDDAASSGPDGPTDAEVSPDAKDGGGGADVGPDTPSDVATDAGTDDADAAPGEDGALDVDDDVETDPGTLEAGEPCTSSAECTAGVCLEVPGFPESICAVTCETATCPDDFSCRTVSPVEGPDTSACLAIDDTFCAPCTDDSECAADLMCKDYGGASSCLAPCDDDTPCPSDTTCAELEADLWVCLPDSGACPQCLDLDGDGFGRGSDCLGPDCDPVNAAVFPNATELCNGADDDCDDAIDEDFTTLGDPCRIGQGACETTGTLACSDEGGVECTGEVGVGTDEICDNIDNDCDGAVDEELVRPCGWIGVCVDSVETCGAGVWTCQRPPAYADPDTTCDGIDNDCDGVPDSGILCGGECCAPGQSCRFDACVDDLGACVEDTDCQEDSYCEAGECLPYGTGPRGDVNDACTRLAIAGIFQPALQCEWTSATEWPNHVQVLGTPTVADFNFDDDPDTIEPSIVFSSYDGLDGDSGVMTTLDGVLRIIDGATCETQFSLGPYLNGSNPVAIGDLDGDGRPEIVAHQNTGGIIAYRYDSAAAGWSTLFVGHHSDGTEVIYSEGATGWGGPSLADLNDDGVTEILSGGLVYDATGMLLDAGLPLNALYGHGNFPVAADVDRDGRVELVTGSDVWEFDPTTMGWVREASGGGSGYTAVADFGTFTADAAADDRGTLDGLAEVAVVADGFARVETNGGRTIFGPIALPASSGGGPPTIGDFDGDGRAELSAAGSDSITIFDPDCTPGGDPVFCSSGRTDGILWWRVSQDHSSNITGSSLFDFEGDGAVEVVYADECFTRVYDGDDGRVLFSQWRSSCTWYENPIVADVDGDFSAELVVPSNESCGTVPSTAGGQPYETSPNGQPMDPLFAGLSCVTGEDCVSGLCDAGLCRCASVIECGGGGGFVCAAPPAGTPGTGNTCRAEWVGPIHGIRVYHDSLDRWVGSRTIWNQHAYDITGINEDGTVPRTSDVTPNWAIAGLNNFRQNIQGDFRPDHSPDLTGGGGSFGDTCTNEDDVPLYTRVCNRGTNPVADGVSVNFYDGDPDQGGTLACAASTSRNLLPGECELVTCTWLEAPTTVGRDVTVVVDAAGERTECEEGNNRAVIRDVVCYPW